MSLRRFGHSWRDVDAFLENSRRYDSKTAHKWSAILVNRDFNAFINQERGGKNGDTLWDYYPGFELETIKFVFEECSKKKISTREALKREIFSITTALISCFLISCGHKYVAAMQLRRFSGSLMIQFPTSYWKMQAQLLS